ncbi:MAG: hypothetical protein HOL70_14985 [Candidatus Marinimicrobia bacterium]|nr:hypothetical protein [Candidatus Neomarinimicrobiota bacterium]
MSARLKTEPIFLSIELDKSVMIYGQMGGSITRLSQPEKSAGHLDSL